MHCSLLLGLGALIGHLKKTIRDHTKKKEENKVSSIVTVQTSRTQNFPTQPKYVLTEMVFGSILGYLIGSLDQLQVLSLNSTLSFAHRLPRVNTKRTNNTFIFQWPANAMRLRRNPRLFLKNFCIRMEMFLTYCNYN